MRHVKEELSERLHSCECGALAQRDLFSAFLARCAEKDGDQYILDTSKARTAWLGAEPLMRQVVSRILDESANGGAFPASFGLQALRQSGSPVKPEFRSETGGRTTAKAGGCCNSLSICGDELREPRKGRCRLR